MRKAGADKRHINLLLIGSENFNTLPRDRLPSPGNGLL
jgi:hypothetical protein